MDLKQNKRKQKKWITVLLVILSFCCGCTNATSVHPQPTTFYANDLYAAQIQNGTVRYLYQSKFISDNSEAKCPVFQEYISAGIVEGERFELSVLKRQKMQNSKNAMCAWMQIRTQQWMRFQERLQISAAARF